MKHTQGINRRYVPYGINGLYYVYDNQENVIPLGYGNKYGTKAKIKAICDKLNKELKPPYKATL